MLRQVTHISPNILENQGDRSVDQGAESDQSLFDQFSEILDKIATSLTEVRQNQDLRGLGDLSTSIGQVAAQQITQKAPVTERKVIEQSSRGDDETGARLSGVENTGPVINSESRESKENLEAAGADRDLPARQVQRVETEQGEPRRESLPQDSHPSQRDQNQFVTQKEIVVTSPELQPQSPLNTEVQVQVAVQASTVATEAQVQIPADRNIEAELQAPGSPRVAQELDPAVQEPQALEASKNDSTPKMTVAAQIQPAAHESQTAPVSGVTNTAQTPQDIRPELSVEPEIINATATSSNQPLIQADMATASPVQQEQSLKNDQTRLLDNQQILIQSAQALISQALLFVPAKQMLEATAPQKLLSPNQLLQNSASINSNNQSVASPLLQSKFAQSLQEKSSTRELPRPAALRTMERVESALKEVARSKDGKTISLRLDPPSLGSVKIDVTFKDGQLHARFVAESAQVNALLRDQSHELQQMLRRAGIQAERITISVGGESQVDINQNFSSFDKQSSEQFRESARVSGGAFDSVELQSDGSKSSAVSPRPLDHWVA